MRRMVVPAIAALILGACASFKDIQNSEPVFSGTFDGSYESIAACVTLDWNRATNAAYGMVVDRANKTAYVTMRGTGPLIVASDETRFIESAPGRVLIEYRRPPALIGPSEETWDSIKRCAEERRADG